MLLDADAVSQALRPSLVLVLSFTKAALCCHPTSLAYCDHHVHSATTTPPLHTDDHGMPPTPTLTAVPHPVPPDMTHPHSHSQRLHASSSCSASMPLKAYRGILCGQIHGHGGGAVSSSGAGGGGDDDDNSNDKHNANSYPGHWQARPPSQP